MRWLVLVGRTGTFTYRMLMTVLVGQSIAVFFGALVARGTALASGDARAGTYLWLGVGLAVLCLVAAGLMRTPYGVTLGWVVQVATFVSATVVPAMLVVGLIFLALWVTCLHQGPRAEALAAQRRAELDAAERGEGPQLG
ncbi:DUF4233 domain-containing protein [Lapillicoccus jejuensis]|uniref:Uncharacterized protein DUF4233 n=1 Tax=Lapillicoccus jejuensis TaxID=402171 RepID=A0A542E3T0_9MICO|nr:DUF4233 domain-containing protein [Lapillicoccus jejuensis]TQJ10003.1 uncharacterized protein DUF4233 [Lapillicoccus jejuensis]